MWFVSLPLLPFLPLVVLYFASNAANAFAVGKVDRKDNDKMAAFSCAFITEKEGDAAGHKFRIVKVDCPAFAARPENWLGSPPQTVYFEKLSNVIEVTRRDVTVGSLVMIVNPVKIKVAVRVPRGLGYVKTFWESPRFYTAQMLLHGF
jgi:hypothetical protein